MLTRLKPNRHTAGGSNPVLSKAFLVLDSWGGAERGILPWTYSISFYMSMVYIPIVCVCVYIYIYVHGVYTYSIII